MISRPLSVIVPIFTMPRRTKKNVRSLSPNSYITSPCAKALAARFGNRMSQNLPRKTGANADDRPASRATVSSVITIALPLGYARGSLYERLHTGGRDDPDVLGIWRRSSHLASIADFLSQITHVREL